jgi:hypothetical protein
MNAAPRLPPDPETRGTPPRSRQLVISLIVACAMFMQNLHCKAITHTG